MTTKEAPERADMPEWAPDFLKHAGGELYLFLDTQKMKIKVANEKTKVSSGAAAMREARIHIISHMMAYPMDARLRMRAAVSIRGALIKAGEAAKDDYVMVVDKYALSSVPDMIAEGHMKHGDGNATVCCVRELGVKELKMTKERALKMYVDAFVPAAKAGREKGILMLGFERDPADGKYKSDGRIQNSGLIRMLPDGRGGLIAGMGRESKDDIITKDVYWVSYVDNV